MHILHAKPLTHSFYNFIRSTLGTFLCCLKREPIEVVTTWLSDFVFLFFLMFFFNLKLDFFNIWRKVSVFIQCDDLWCCAIRWFNANQLDVHLVASALGNHSQPVATRLCVAMLHKSINNFTFSMNRFWGSAARWIPRVSILMTLFAAKRLDFCAIFIRLAFFLVQVHYNWTSCSQQKCRSCLPFKNYKTIENYFKRN